MSSQNRENRIAVVLYSFARTASSVETFLIKPDTRAQGYIGHCTHFALISAHYWQLFNSFISTTQKYTNDYNWIWV